jgi:hypothetical protein
MPAADSRSPPGGEKQGQKNADRPCHLSRELGAILRQASKADPRSDPSVHLAVIETRKAQEVEVFLRACALRLEKI